MRTLVVLSLAAALAASTGCKKKGGGSWAVGDDGAMLSIGDDLSIGHHGVDGAANLRGIACRDGAIGWVVGDGGTALRSDPDGAWWPLELGTQRDLRAVAAAASDRVYVAGDGIAAISDDSGDSWSAIPGADASYTATATSYDGRLLLLAGVDGSIWRAVDGATPELVASAGVALRGIALAAGDRRAIAVGDGGTMLASEDAGATWTALPSAPGDLRDAWVGDDGTAAAVGAGGLLVRVVDGEVDASAIADTDLNGLHLSADGTGVVVGAAGTLLVSDDGGQVWTTLDAGTAVDLRAVDDFYGAAAR